MTVHPVDLTSAGVPSPPPDGAAPDVAAVTGAAGDIIRLSGPADSAVAVTFLYGPGWCCTTVRVLYLTGPVDLTLGREKPVGWVWYPADGPPRVGGIRWTGPDTAG